MAFLLLQTVDLHDPPLQNRRAAAAALDEIVRFLLILRDLLLDRDVELLRHLIALLGVVDDEKAVRREPLVVAVAFAQLLDEALKRAHLLHRVLRHKIEMAVDTHLCRLQIAQEVLADCLHLLAVRAHLVQLKQLFRPPAQRRHIHIGIGRDVVVAEAPGLLVIEDVRQRRPYTSLPQRIGELPPSGSYPD